MMKANHSVVSPGLVNSESISNFSPLILRHP